MFELFKQYCDSYGYAVLGAGVMLENAGIPVPGETAVIAAGFLASAAGDRVLDIRLVIAAAILAAVIGDNIGFWLGHRLARPRLQEGKGFLFLNRRTLAVAEGYFARFGSWTIFFARFITGIRVIGALAAGTAGMEWRRFLVANAAGAAVWATTFALLGYYFGQNWELLERWTGRTGLVLLAVAIVGGYLLWRYREHWLPSARSDAPVGAAGSNRDSQSVE
jgi:membrane protein DedA with SNARE-associated domain